MIDNTKMTFHERLNYLTKCTPAEWDALCKGCGICCLGKVAISMGGGTAYLRTVCKDLDLKTKKCTVYETRLNKPNCKKVNLDVVLKGELIPASCGYSEFLYGPAEFPAKIDFQTLRPIKNMNNMGLSDIMGLLIPESVLWNKRKFTR